MGNSSFVAVRGPKGDKGDKGDTGATGADATGGGGPPELGGLFGEYLLNENNHASHFSSLVPVTGINMLPAANGHFSKFPFQLASVTATEGFPDPTGGSRATNIVAGSGGGVLLPHLHGYPAAPYTQGVFMANNTGTDVVVRFWRDGGNYGPNITLPAMVSGQHVWGEYFDTRTDYSGSGNLNLGITGDAGGDPFDILIYNFRIEKGNYVSEFPAYSYAANSVIGDGGTMPVPIAAGVDFGTDSGTASGLLVDHPRTTFQEFSIYQVIKWPSSRTTWDSGYAYAFSTESPGDVIELILNNPSATYKANFGGLQIWAERDVVVFDTDQWIVIGFTFDGSVGRIFFNNTPVGYLAGTNDPLVATGMGFFCNAENFSEGAPVQAAYTAVYNKGHSLDQWRKNFGYLTSFLADRATLAVNNKIVIIEGDQNSTTAGDVQSSYAQSGIRVSAGVYVGRDMVNVDSLGTIAGMTARLPQLYECFTPGATVVLSLLSGRDDLQTMSATDAMTALTTYINTVKTQAATVVGMTLKIMVGTLLPTTHAEEAEIPDFNTALLAATSLYDVVFDFAALGLDPTSGDYQGGGYAPTQTCHDTKLRPVWLAALTSLFP